MIELDGAQGEGGGQIVRSALALSILTGTPVCIRNVRGGRAKPGLLRQHLCAVQAAVRVGSARAEGAELGSRELSFEPGPVVAGYHEVRIGSAGSTTLVLQTVLPPLLTAAEASTFVVEGGTHNPFAPPAPFLAAAFGRALTRMGASVSFRLERLGLYPAGGGRLVMHIASGTTLRPLELLQRGAVRRMSATIVVAGVPTSVAGRERHVLQTRLGLAPREVTIVDAERTTGPGNVVLVEVECEETTEVFVALGERGKPAEAVAEDAARDALAWLEADVPVGEHLADQLLLPLALAGGGAFRTTRPSLHTQTNAYVLERFLGARTTWREDAPGRFLVEVRAPG